MSCLSSSHRPSSMDVNEKHDDGEIRWESKADMKSMSMDVHHAIEQNDTQTMETLFTFFPPHETETHGFGIGQLKIDYKKSFLHSRLWLAFIIKCKRNWKKKKRRETKWNKSWKHLKVVSVTRGKLLLQLTEPLFKLWHSTLVLVDFG